MAPRKVENLLALAVLASLAERPMHRYEIATTIRERGKERQLAVKIGSLYTVVQSLERHGLVVAGETSREGARPEKTSYAITPAGRRELRDWTRDLVASPEDEQTLFTAGLSVLAALAPDEAIAALRARAGRLADRIEARREALGRDLASVPRLFLIEDEYALALLETEARWLDGLLADLDSGTFPGLAEWRAYHGAAADGPSTDRVRRPSSSEGDPS